MPAPRTSLPTARVRRHHRPRQLQRCVKALEAKGYTFASAELEMVPQTYVTMTGEDDVKNMNKLIDMLEDNEDVQNVWHNWQQD